jgi:hypothetical protein
MMTPLEKILEAEFEDYVTKISELESELAMKTPKWIEVTDDPATLPPMGQTVIIREGSGNDFERFGYRDGNHLTGWRWYQSRLAYWSGCNQSVEPDSCEDARSPTHWRPIA